MKGARANIGSKTTPMSGQQSTRLHAGGQQRPVAHRPQAATPDVSRSGSREIARVDSAGLIAAGTQTTGGQSVQQSKPAGSGSPGGAYPRGEHD